MNNILYHYLHNILQVFTDDILVYSKNEEEHQEHFRLVLNILREHQLYDEINKC